MADSRGTKLRFWNGGDVRPETVSAVLTDDTSTAVVEPPSPVPDCPGPAETIPTAIESSPVPTDERPPTEAPSVAVIDAPAAKPHPARIGPFELEQQAAIVAGGLHVPATGAAGTPVAGRTVTVTLAPLGGPGEREVAIRSGSLPSVRHRGLLPVLGAGIADGWSFVVQPPARSATLAELLVAQGTMPPQAVEAALLELSGALSSLHEAGFVHGDVRPENVLLDAEQRTVLAGLVLATGPAEQLPEEIAPYAAPERRSGPPTSATDQFALAATVVTMVAGKPPRSHGGAALIGLDLGLPAPVVDVLVRGLAGEPGNRYPSVDAFAEAFRRAMDNGADSLVAGVYEAISARDQVMANLLVEGALRLRPNHPQATPVRDQLQSGTAMAHPGALPPGLGGAVAPLDDSLPALPLGFEMPQLAPVSTTSGGSNPWLTFGIGVGFCMILLVVGVVLVMMFASQ